MQKPNIENIVKKINIPNSDVVRENLRKWYNKSVRIFFERADIFLLIMCTVCAIFGTIMVRSATASYTNPTKYVIVQIFSIFLGIVAYVIFTVIDSDILGDNWQVLCVVNVLLLVALVIFGQDDGTGNKSWIRFAGIGVQPSEVIKVLYIIVSAKQMTTLKEHSDINKFSSIVQMAGHFAIVFGMIVVVSSDLGSATIILGIFLVMLFMLGVKLYWFGVGFAAVAAVVPLLWVYFLKDYQRQRLIAPYDPSIDPDGYGITWQTTQSKLALASGRLTGLGFGDGTQTQRSTFTGKHTDFIFSVVGEELGMIGCVIVLILLSIIVVHCFRVGMKAGGTFDMLICVGVAAALGIQTFINIGMCIGVTPVIGITLPYFSYGGSSMATLYAAAGLVSGVKFKPKPQQFRMVFGKIE